MAACGQKLSALVSSQLESWRPAPGGPQGWPTQLLRPRGLPALPAVPGSGPGSGPTRPPRRLVPGPAVLPGFQGSAVSAGLPGPERVRRPEGKG